MKAFALALGFWVLVGVALLALIKMLVKRAT